ncbi:MAG: hypothetical protein QOC69_3690, partial [Mycobacterium sp.]|nr:hypothetical protein [Mycobacterium sp.]
MAGNTISPSSSWRALAQALWRSCGVAASSDATRSRCCAFQPLLPFGREVAAPPPDRIGLGHVEGRRILVHGVAVVQLRAVVTDRVVDGRWAQQ